MGTWKWTHQQSNSAADCSGDWSDDASVTIDGELGYTLNANGTMSDLSGTMTVPWSSSGTTGTYMGQDILTFEEQSDGSWVMWMELAGTDGSGNAVNCNRSGYTKQ